MPYGNRRSRWTSTIGSPLGIDTARWPFDPLDSRHYAHDHVIDNAGPGLDVAGKLAGSDASRRTVSWKRGQSGLV